MAGLADTYDLKDEKQAKEYLDNLGVEYRYQCFKEKKPEGCHRLGDFLEAFRQDFEKARKVYQTNCSDMKYPKSCFKYANYCLLGRGGSSEMDEAIKSFNVGCDGGDSGSCYNAAIMHTSGKMNKKKDYIAAKSFLERACELKDPMSCYVLGSLYISGKEGIPKDMKQAFKYTATGCELNQMYACANLSQMYRKGDGVEQNETLAEQYKAKAKSLHKSATVGSEDTSKGIRFGE